MIDGMPVVDMQHHYIPPEALKLCGRTAEFDFSIAINHSSNFKLITDIQANLAFMDRAGIDAAILSTGSFTPNGLAFCRACNDGYGAVLREHPTRFKGMIHVYPLDDAQQNREEIQRARDLGLHGLALCSSYGDVTLDDERMHPTYQAAVDLDMPVYVHPSIRRPIWGGDRYNMTSTLSREYDIIKGFNELFYGVLPRFPQLKVIVGHLGGGLPALKGRLLAFHQPEEIDIPPHQRGHGLSIIEAQELGLVDHYERRLDNFLFDAAGYGGWLPVMRAAFDGLGARRLCFGTDYPFEFTTGARPVIESIAGLDVAADDKKKFFGANLAAIFGC